MELDRDLICLQDTLYSLWQRGLLNKRDGLSQVIEAIGGILECVEDGARSKLTFLMVLYTRLSVSKKLEHDNFVGHIYKEPYIEKDYLIIYIYHLNIQLELFRVIENCPAPIGLELLDIIIRKLGESYFFKDEFGVKHFYHLWQSVFVKLCKLVTKLHAENCTQKFVSSFREVYDIIQDILIQSMTCPVPKQCELVGLHLYYFFKTFLYCIMLQKSPCVSDDPLYKLSTEFDFDEGHFCSNALINCIEQVFENISNIAKHLTVDMWMFFAEYYCDLDPKNSVQLLIGDLVYKILKEVKSYNYNVPSDVVNFLSSIALNKSDLWNTAGIEDIISSIRNGEKECLKVLIRHPDFNKRIVIECLIDHLEAGDSDDLNLILDTSYEYLHSHKQDEDLNLMKKLFLTALKKVEDCSQWLEKIFERYQPGLLTTSETPEELIETFNKISKGRDIPQCELISLCVQSPVDTVKKIFHISLCSSEQKKFAIEMLKLLKCPCNISHSGGLKLVDYVLLKSVLEDLRDKEKRSFIDLVIQLGKENLLGPSFYNNLLTCIKEYSEKDMLEKAMLCLEVTHAVLDLKIFRFHKSAFLVFMSQVLGYFSWDLESFSVVKANGRDQVDSILTLTINELDVGQNGSSFEWARRQILKSWEVNQAYFCDLWFAFNSDWCGSGNFHSLILALAHSQHKSDHLRKFLINTNEPVEVRASVVLSLIMLLPVLTFQKWSSIFKELVMVWKELNSETCAVNVYHQVLDMFGSALQVLGMNLKEKDSTYPCYKYCLRNFGKLAKQFCPKMREESLVRTFERIFLLLGLIEDEDKRKSCWEIFPPVLMELVENLKRKSSGEAHMNEIEELLPFLDLKDVAEGIRKRLH